MQIIEERGRTGENGAKNFLPFAQADRLIYCQNWATFKISFREQI